MASCINPANCWLYAKLNCNTKLFGFKFRALLNY